MQIGRSNGSNGLSEKLLVWFFAGVKMKIILKIFSTILGVKIANFNIFYSIYDSKLPIWTKMVILTPKMVEFLCGIIFILTAVKNYTSNFTDSPFGLNYYSSSNASLISPSNPHYYSMYIQNNSNNC